jgi:uncharacterized repeat protein (TIGR03803 family)
MNRDIALAFVWISAAAATSIYAQDSQAPSLTSLFSFGYTNGQSPNRLVRTRDGNFYGTTYGGGLGGSACSSTFKCGVIFRFSLASGLQIIHRFSGSDGGNPVTGLIPAATGGFYGTTYYGGARSGGTVFQFSGAALSTVYAFGAMGEGQQPNSLIQASDGNLYGTTESGVGAAQFGTIFRLTPGGSLTTLKAYAGGHPAVGILPQGIIEASDYNFYGAIGQGGTTTSLGSIFQLTPGGQYNTLHTFRRSDGGILEAGLIQASDGNFYGVTSAGGDPTHCKSAFVPGCGTVFRITSSGVFTVLHRFKNSDGASPNAELFQAADGFLYGSTYGGGPAPTCPASPVSGLGCGTIFRISLNGNLTTLYYFMGLDGANPGSPLIQGLDGSLYGTTDRGGTSGAGTIFRLTPPVP